MKTPEELYLEREKRVGDTIALKMPDRIPLLLFFGFFPAKYAGFTVQEVMYDPEKLWESEEKVLTDFPMDMAHNPFPLRFLGPLLEVLDFKALVWPGHGLSSNDTYQFVEGEYMKAEEYDHFLLDPSDFMVRRFWPRIYGALKAFEKIPPLHSFITYYMGTPHGFAPFSSPELIAGPGSAQEGRGEIGPGGLLFPEIRPENQGPWISHSGRRPLPGPFRYAGRFFPGDQGPDARHVPEAGKGDSGLRETPAHHGRDGGECRPGLREFPGSLFPSIKAWTVLCPWTSLKNSSGPLFGS